MKYELEKDEELFYTFDGKEHVNEDLALAILFADGILSVSERQTVEHHYRVDDGKLYNDETKPTYAGESTTIVFVNCNDLFYWGTADGECLPNKEICSLLKLHLADKQFGSDKWCCFRRNLRPQVPIVKRMKEAGVWDDTMEALPAPEPS